MTAHSTNPYLRTRILTANAQELRLMLYDGAIRFIRQGQQALQKRDFEGSYNGFARAKRIVLELSTSLNHEIDPQLCDKLHALYNYIYRLLVETSLQRNAAIADEAVSLLEYERQTWQMMMEQGGTPRPPHEVPASATDPTAPAPPAPPDPPVDPGRPRNTPATPPAYPLPHVDGPGTLSASA